MSSRRSSSDRGSAAACPLIVAAGIGFSMLAVPFSEAAAPAQQQLEQLQRQLQEQQRMLLQMQRQLDEQQKITEALLRENTQIKKQVLDAKTTAEKVEQEVSERPADTLDAPVYSGQDRVKLAISGHVNRAMNFAGDGKSTKYYNVDNDASDSRVRLIGTGKVDGDLTIGTQIEVALSPNNSEEVSQNNEDSGDTFDQRVVELFALSETYGSLWLGKGSSASDNTAEQDLSGTDVIQYVSSADFAGGLQFRNNDDKALSGIALKQAFSEFDGNGRTNRIRYDTPRFYGFQARASASDNQRSSGSLWWSGQGHGFKIASAGGLSDPSKDRVDYRLDGSMSVLHEDTGLNLTLAGGMDQQDDSGNPTQLYMKLGWLADIVDFGKTATGVDFVRSNNLPDRSARGYSLSGAVVQQIPDWGSEIYAQYRWYTLEGAGVKDINVGTLGARVKF